MDHTGYFKVSIPNAIRSLRLSCTWQHFNVKGFFMYILRPFYSHRPFRGTLTVGFYAVGFLILLDTDYSGEWVQVIDIHKDAS